MKITDKLVNCNSRSDTFEIIPIGDVHLGARNCAEKPLRKLIKEVAGSDNKFIIGGGDIVDAVTPQDLKRFDFDSLPDWMVEGNALDTREKLNDILNQQIERAVEIFQPAAQKGKIWGFVRGNHEWMVQMRTNRAVQKALCRRLGVDDLKEEALIRIKFVRNKCGYATIILYIRHGYGGGRTPGAEINKLDRMLNEWEIADICFSGHTHTYDIAPPKAVLEIPRKGKLPLECTCRYRWAGNWGTWLYSHQGGYASRACYPARPMLRCVATIKPFAQQWISDRPDAPRSRKAAYKPHIELRGITI